MKEQKDFEKILNKVDNVDLVPDDMLKDMDFYELAYYMQSLNSISSTLSPNKELERTEN